MKPTVVLYPVSAMGHVVPMVELAKLFLLHDLAVTVVIMHSPVNHPSLDPFLARVSAAYPSLSFHRLPPPVTEPPTGSSNMVTFFERMRLNNPLLLDFLVAHRRAADVRAVILDFFCAAALDVTAELCLTAHIFFSSSAASLAIFLYLPTIESTTELSFCELGDAPVHFPGLPPIAASDMPSHLMDRAGEIYERLVIIFQRMLDADSIFINSFEPLESEAVHALRAGACVPSRRMPEVYCIGPVISGVGGDGNERAECLKWLDVQPRGSVVFLCFGSMGSFSVAQLKEIAAGLERSGQRFLWVVRTPKDSPDSLDLEAFLPEGFLVRTKQRGMVVESWAPQVEVLNHEAVAAFVTHCGWNSTLEAIAAGVAMVAWPLYAEQRLNKVLLAERTGLAVAMEGYEKEMVTAEEVEAKVRWVMESEGGKELRERASSMKAAAAAAMAEGGSSRQALLEIVKSLYR